MHKRGFTLIELLVVIAIIAILASILFPVFAKAREKARQATCNSNIRQLATAVQMYVQDNNSRFPGMVAGTAAVANNPAWEDALLTYVGSKKIYFCPSDAFADKDAAPVSYGYNGLLTRLDGSGLNEAQVKSPVEVGAICDASPTKKWGFGGLVGGGSWMVDDTRTVKPEPRHGGVVVGYCDGHAKYQPGKKSDLKDSSSLVTRGFYMANALQLLDNPAGGLNKGSYATGTVLATEITIGGDYCLYPLLTAAAEVWKNAHNINWYSRGFMGQGYRAGRVTPVAGVADWVWGYGDAADIGQDGGIASRGVAVDCMVVIVSRNTKIKRLQVASTDTGVAWLGSGTTAGGSNTPFINQQYVCTTANIGAYFTNTLLYYSLGTPPVQATNTGFSADNHQVYTYNVDSGSRKYFARNMGLNPVGIVGRRAGETSPYSDAITNLTEAVIVENDQDMVDKVAADPYGIGYCSSIFADLDRVQVLAITNLLGSKVCYFPNANIKYRYQVGDDAPAGANADGTWAPGTTWPMVRTLYAVFGSGASFITANNTTFGGVMLESDVPTPSTANLGRTQLLLGPLFKASYWRLGAGDK